MKALKTFFFLGSLLLTLLSSCQVQRQAQPRIALKLIADGFTSPVALIDAGDGSHRLFVVDQTGLIWILANGTRLDRPFLDLRQRVVKLNAFYDERGLLGLAFHPQFAQNGQFYVSYSGLLRTGLSPEEWDHTTYISEFTVSADPDRADPGSERVLLAMDKPGYNYEAGNLAFGPDGYLYIATGDSVRDPATESGKYAQDLSSLLGKILRIDVDRTTDTGQNYAIPGDNPFVTGEGRPEGEIWAFGLRAPWRIGFDRQTGTLWAGDVGQSAREEVDIIKKGANYGWNVMEGANCRQGNSCDKSAFTPPIIDYATADGNCAIVGGFVYRGEAIAALRGAYVYGDYCSGKVWALRYDGMRVTEQSQIAAVGGPMSSFSEDTHGELYALAFGDRGAVLKLTP